MARKPTSLRLSDPEKRVLGAAAEREGRSTAELIRESALEHAVGVLERELEDLRPETESDD